MTSIVNQAFYEELFRLGLKLYTDNVGIVPVRETAVRLMAMAESVIGQQPSWPKDVPVRYQHLTVYPPKTDGFDHRKVQS